MEQHRHIKFGDGYITWWSKIKPTKQQIEAFENIRDLVSNLPMVNVEYNTSF